MILKAGTYRFNDTINTDAPLEVENPNIYAVDFIYNGTTYMYMVFANESAGDSTYTFDITILNFSDSLESDGVEIYNYSIFNGNLDEQYNGYQVPFPLDITINYDQSVSTLIGEFIISNTNYNEVNGGTTVKQFTRLYKGEVVSSTTTKQLRKLTTEEPIIEYGLFDANDNLVASWDTLVNTYGMDIEGYYEYRSDNPARPSNVLANNSELASGIKLVMPNTVTKIGNSAFSECKQLRFITFSESLQRIENYAFEDTSLVGKVVIPDSVEYIGTDAFGYTDIFEIILPQTLDTISYQMFHWCDVLKNITIPKTVTTIGPYAFHHCSNLNSEMIMPKSVMHIMESAFAHSSVTTLIYEGTMEEWGAITFGDNWNRDYPTQSPPRVHTVQCTDGTITL